MVSRFFERQAKYIYESDRPDQQNQRNHKNWDEPKKTLGSYMTGVQLRVYGVINSDGPIKAGDVFRQIYPKSALAPEPAINTIQNVVSSIRDHLGDVSIITTRDGYITSRARINSIVGKGNGKI